MRELVNDALKNDLRYLKATLIFFVIQFSLVFLALAQPTSNQSNEHSAAQKENPLDILTGNTTDARLFQLRKFYFIENALSTISSVASDSSLQFQMQSNKRLSLFLTREELHEIRPQGVDPIGEELLRRYRDVSPVLPIIPLLSHGIKSVADKLSTTGKEPLGFALLIPKDIEIDILRVLWVKSAATPSEIYAPIDSLWPITSEDLHRVLEEMVARGFLARKKISPSHGFNLFGITQFELSSKNRKNEVYVYWPVVSKEKLITYLEAKRFLALASSEKPGTNGENNNYQKLLEEKLYRILQ
ncbi:MAG: hypothetical protein ACE5IW_09475 [bacterium]